MMRTTAAEEKLKKRIDEISQIALELRNQYDIAAAEFADDIEVAFFNRLKHDLKNALTKAQSLLVCAEYKKYNQTIKK